MNRLPRIFLYLFATLFSLGLLGAIALGVLIMVLEPKLPSVDSLKDVRYQVPLQVYSRDGVLIAEFGEKKRQPLTFDQIPHDMVQAFVAAEDERFWEHPGVDYQGILRAIWYLVRTGEKGPGGSTITMQVARNFFLSREKTYLRKLNEILLALKIDRELTKKEIITLYLNKIYLGQRAYGAGAAAEVYYGKPVGQLTLPEIAMIAGLPKAPSSMNPLANPKRARERRAYVLRRMKELGFINDKAYEDAVAAPLTASFHGLTNELAAPYVAEMARAETVARFGDDVYTDGYKVYTTVDSHLQRVATQSVRDGLIAYTKRHGYRGPEAHVDLAKYDNGDAIDELLQDYRVVGGLEPALVLAVDKDGAKLALSNGRRADLPFSGAAWAKPFVNQSVVGSAPKDMTDVVKPGDLIRVRKQGDSLELSQVPEVEGALVSLAPRDGAVRALVGGFDFFQSKFNRATQARRQPGSNFKPFIYSAALDHGFTPATLINDAPVVFRDSGLESTWRPENYSGKFFGPTRMREGLVHSRNLVSIRILRAIGVDYAVDYAQNFGFKPSELPHNLSLALGSVSLTPMEIARGYSTFANDGYLITPYLVSRIEDGNGNKVFSANPVQACTDCGEDKNAPHPVDAGLAEALNPPVKPAKRTLTPQNVYLMTSMMQDVIRHGTGRHALTLHRSDLAGKTGTTNDQRDAWFSGFNADVETTVWVGFDQVHSLGPAETGARAALPIWIDYMGEALKNTPETKLDQPPGLVTVRIDPDTGLVASSNNPKAIFETFREDNVPAKEPEAGATAATSGEGGGGSSSKPLF